MRAQASSLPFTPVFAALVSIINTKLPTVGELLVTRVVSQFRRAYRRNDKITCVATTIFVAQLVNQQVAHHLLAFEMIILLLEKPTDDSVEIAVGFTKEVGAFLSEAEPKANNSVYERFRSILHEATISKRVQYMIEVLFQVRKDRFKDNPVLPEGLDLVEEDDIITHPIHLDDDLQVQEGLSSSNSVLFSDLIRCVSDRCSLWSCVQMFTNSTRILSRMKKNTLASRMRSWVLILTRTRVVRTVGATKAAKVKQTLRLV